MRCLQVVSALLEGPSLPWRGWVALLDANVGKSCFHELTTDTHTHTQINTNGFTHGSAAAQLHLDVADTGSRLDDVERKKLRGMRRQTAWCTAAWMLEFMMRPVRSWALVAQLGVPLHGCASGRRCAQLRAAQCSRYALGRWSRSRGTMTWLCFWARECAAEGSWQNENVAGTLLGACRAARSTTAWMLEFMMWPVRSWALVALSAQCWLLLLLLLLLLLPLLLFQNYSENRFLELKNDVWTRY